MKKRKYNMSQKKLDHIKSMTDWEKRLEIFRLYNQGWTYDQIGEKLDITKQRVGEIYRSIEHMTLEEVEAEYTKSLE